MVQDPLFRVQFVANTVYVCFCFGGARFGGSGLQWAWVRILVKCLDHAFRFLVSRLQGLCS